MENFQSGANEHKLEIVDAEFCIFMRSVSDQDNFKGAVTFHSASQSKDG